MRVVIGATLLGIAGLSLHTSGCGGSSDTLGFTNANGSGDETGSGTTAIGGGGTGGGTGTGGSGGQACVPVDEVCGNGLDDDCDGQVDEACGCQVGDTQTCYSGPAGTEGVGNCAAGMQGCDPATHTWGACSGDILPSSESCDEQDDDCDGETDEDIAPFVCGVGGCATVVEGCVDGEVPSCMPGLPSSEACDGIDNDCDGQTDESFPNQGSACASGVPGACAGGTLQCVAGAAACVPNLLPSSETCDGVDNDCDGTVDEDIPGTGGSCSTGYQGVCSAGAISCQGGTLDCFPITPASNELCDSLDNDCDGQIDESNAGGGGACVTGQPGVCSAGVQVCTGGALVCVPSTLGSPESCNGLDDDCDGQVDDGNPGAGPCGCGGTSQCVNGALVCGGWVTYLSEPFANNNAGWTLGTEWQIAPATVGPVWSCADPGTDTTATADNGVAGVIIGGCSTSSVNKIIHDYYYLTSPAFDTSAAPGVFLKFRRWLRSDFGSYMNNVIEVWNGSSWVLVWQSGAMSINDAVWQTINHNLSAYKNASMKIRWGFSVGSTYVANVGSWSIDDVLVTSALCP